MNTISSLDRARIQERDQAREYKPEKKWTDKVDFLFGLGIALLIICLVPLLAQGVR